MALKAVSAPLGSPVGGSGTTGTIPVWSSGTTLGDSIISQNNGTNRLLVAGGTAAAAANGTDITLQAQSGGTGNTNGGSIFLQPGANAGTGTRGFVRIDNGLGVDANLYFGGGTGPSAPYGVGQRAYSGQSHTCVFASAGYAAARASIGMVSGGVYTPALNVDPSGNVGIGTASPGALLDVNTGSAPGSYVTSTRLSQTGTAANSGQRILFYNSQQTWEQGAIGSTREGANANFALTFFTSVSGTNAERARIDSSGALLVGTQTNPLSPNTKLMVSDANNGKGFEFRPGATGTVLVYDRTGGTFLPTDWQSTTFRLSQTAATFDASTAGAGLKLPATPGNADTQTLDCYQEAAWAPTVSLETNCTGVTITNGRYTKIGRLVTVEAYATLTVTAATTLTYFYLTIPVNRVSGNVSGCGTAVATASGFVGSVFNGGATSNTVGVIFQATNPFGAGGTQFVAFSYSYYSAT